MTAADRLLVPLAGPTEPVLDLVLVPGAGAGPGVFAAWPDARPPGWRISAVCLPGRGGRYGEPFPTTAVAMGEEIAAVVADRTGGPVVLFGHSLGACWAREAASRLRPVLLGTAGCPPPEPGGTVSVGHGSDAADLAWLSDSVAASGLSRSEAADLAELSLPALRSDVALASRWSAPIRPLDCPVVSYYGTADPVPALPWSRHTTATADVSRTAGGHWSAVHAPAAVLRDLAGRVAGQVCGGTSDNATPG